MKGDRAMQEAWTPVVMAMVTAVVALLGLLTRKLLRYIDHKTKWMNAECEADQKTSTRSRVEELAELCVEATMQSFVKGLKRQPDGKKDRSLTGEEKEEAFRLTKSDTIAALVGEGITPGQDVKDALINIAIEAAVGRTKARKLKAGLDIFNAIRALKSN